jgi:hypothetical protein
MITTSTSCSFLAAEELVGSKKEGSIPFEFLPWKLFELAFSMAWKNKIHQKLLSQMEECYVAVEIASPEPFSCRLVQGSQGLVSMPFVHPWATDLCTFVVESLDFWEGNHDWRSWAAPYAWCSGARFLLGSEHDDCERYPSYVDDSP